MAQASILMFAFLFSGECADKAQYLLGLIFWSVESPPRPHPSGERLFQSAARKMFTNVLSHLICDRDSFFRQRCQQR